jgi:sugar (pentulose or hexulose) kinase
MSKETSRIRENILEGKTALGIEFGSTRIKAVLVDETNTPVASGSHEWENQHIDRIWTYSLEAIWNGLQDSYFEVKKDVESKYKVSLNKIGAIGFSGMMHGYMAFDKEDNLLVPFRTWRNNITETASEMLTELLQYPIPQRWSIAHLYQAILNDEQHVQKIEFFTTLAGYIHWKLTGEKVLGVGEASGMFPIDIETKQFDKVMIEKFEKQVENQRFSWKLSEILPKVKSAGEQAGTLSVEGAKLLDKSGELQVGIPICPPEGDAGTGMVATNSVGQRTGNVSAGTSIFSMIVLEKKLSKVYPEIDLVTTPSADLVAMVHSQNCTSDLNAWVGIFKEFSEAFGITVDMNKLFETLFFKALEGDADGGGLLSYCYLSGEHITRFSEGRPMFARTADSNFNLANFMRVNLFTIFGAQKIGYDLLMEENVKVDKILGHGGLFKTKEVGQRIMAAAFNAPVSVMETAGEGGAWGIALLASYMLNRKGDEALDEYLDREVFAGNQGIEVKPDIRDIDGFEQFMVRYKKGLEIERTAIRCLT